MCRIAGVKRAAVTSLDKNIVLSIADTHKVETLCASGGVVLVTRDYFRVMCRCANEKLLVGRQRMQRLLDELVRRLPPAVDATDRRSAPP